MSFVDIIIVFFIAFLVTVIFFYIFKRTGPWEGFWVFLLILFLAAWSARLWVIPSGPLLWGLALVPVFFVVIIFALLIITASSNSDYRTKETPEERVRTERGLKGTGAAFSIIFWVLLIFFIITIIGGYVIK